MGRELASNECLGKCDWKPTEERIDDHQVFECGACHSEWTPAQSWTPRNWDGEVGADVAKAREENPVS